MTSPPYACILQGRLGPRPAARGALYCLLRQSVVCLCGHGEPFRAGGAERPLAGSPPGGLSQVPNPRLKGVPVADVRLRRAAARARRIARRRLRQPNAHAYGDAYPNSHTRADGDPYLNSHAGADGDAFPNPHPSAYVDACANMDSHPHPYAYAYSYADANRRSRPSNLSQRGRRSFLRAHDRWQPCLLGIRWPGASVPACG